MMQKPSRSASWQPTFAFAGLKPAFAWHSWACSWWNGAQGPVSQKKLSFILSSNVAQKEPLSRILMLAMPNSHLYIIPSLTWRNFSSNIMFYFGSVSRALFTCLCCRDGVAPLLNTWSGLHLKLRFPRYDSDSKPGYNGAKLLAYPWRLLTLTEWF